MGSSAFAVPIPINIASCSARITCARRRAFGPVIHRLSPFPVAMHPSKVVAIFKVTSGRPLVTREKKPSFISRAKSPITPTSTSIPASRNLVTPRPDTLGSGSSTATTQREIPASISLSAHGGVLPRWEQGSRLTYTVEPFSLSPARSRASVSACGLPPG